MEVIEMTKADEVEMVEELKASFIQPHNHREATVLGFTTVLVGSIPVNITVREGWTEEGIDSIFDAMDYVGKLVDLRNGLVVTSNQYSTIEVNENGYVTGMRKIPTVYEKGQAQAAAQAGLTEPVNSPFAPGDDAPVETKAQPPKQYTQQAPQQAQGQPSNEIVFPVARIEWEKLSSTGNTTFRVYGGMYQKFGVVCYSEALQNAKFEIGGAGPGWGIQLEGQNWVAHCAIGENGTSPKKVVKFTNEKEPF